MSSLRSPREPEFDNKDELKGYHCTIHKGIMRDPVHTMCGHRFCKSCIEIWLTTNKNTKCPANEEDCVILSENVITTDFATRRDISNLSVVCAFKNFGCRNILTWKDLQNHEDTCEFKHTECPNTCGQFLTEANLSQHLEECEQRIHSEQHSTSHHDLDLVHSFVSQKNSVNKELEKVNLLMTPLFTLADKNEHPQRCRRELNGLENDMQAFEQRLETLGRLFLDGLWNVYYTQKDNMKGKFLTVGKVIDQKESDTARHEQLFEIQDV